MMTNLARWLLVLLVGFAHSYPTTSLPKYPRATIASGEIIGTTTQLSSVPTAVANKFLGIPFAKSPPQRFSLPEDVQPWTSPLMATEFKPSCIQQFTFEFLRNIENNPPLPDSEDCLYLNVFVPASPPPPGGRPIMFWIYGGAFQFGSARLDMYDGSALAVNGDVVVVTANYRMNVFGFPTSPVIPLDQRNVGLYDQRKALAWVSQNIHAFGGNPAKVTIFGESVGGHSVKQLVANPPNPLPFHAAILQSQSKGIPGTDVDSWPVLTEELGCNTTFSDISQLDCIRAASAEQIRGIIDTHSLTFSPTVDNKTNFGHVEDILRSSTAAHVPILIGSNADEGTMLSQTVPNSQLLLAQIFGNDTVAQERARALYPSNLTDPELRTKIFTDGLYTCVTSALAQSFAESGRPTWRYFFNASFYNTQPFPGAGAWHTSEIYEIFGTYPRDNKTTDQQVVLSRFMQHAWTNFAKQPATGPGWEKVQASSGVVEALGMDGRWGGIEVPQGEVDKVCEVYNSAIWRSGL